MTNKTLYLVNPPDKGMLSGFPGALLFLKSWLKMNAPESNVNYVDLALSKKSKNPLDGRIGEISEELKDYQLEQGALYALTSTTATYQNALQTARAIKELDPTASIILGGHHAKNEAENILGLHPEIDYCSTGEGEKTLEDLALGVPEEEVRGLAFRDRNFGLIKRNHVGFLSREELDSFQFNTFDWSPVFESQYDEMLRGQFGYFDISTARGCNLKCTFCAFGDDQLRDMSPNSKAQLLSDMVNSEIYKKSQGVNIHDNDFAQNSKRTHELCDIMIERGLDIDWTIQTRVEHLNNRNEPLVEKLAKAGCVEAYLGVENFDPEIASYLKHVKNPETYLRNTQEAVINTLKYGIGCNINLQLGVPGETEEARQYNLDSLEEIAKTAQMIAKERGNGSQVTIYPQLSVVYPGTPMAKLPVRGTEKYLPKEAFETFTEWEWDREQEGFVEYLGNNFAHGNGGIPLGLLDIDKFVDDNEIIINQDRLSDVNDYLDRMKSIADKYPALRIFEYSDHVEK
ncbi:hypothetical protein CMI42_00435 [Candidatus Pacearchaeota archaeon]|nr:hypothetical protein [Candidatus Pacearchaeota archaeon]|tara:strand:+ start:82 stop:1623 length:1542 start_codon:yes stop_codon:yes gene_type:complete